MHQKRIEMHSINLPMDRSAFLLILINKLVNIHFLKLKQMGMCYFIHQRIRRHSFLCRIGSKCVRLSRDGVKAFSFEPKSMELGYFMQKESKNICFLWKRIYVQFFMQKRFKMRSFMQKRFYMDLFLSYLGMVFSKVWIPKKDWISTGLKRVMLNIHFKTRSFQESNSYSPINTIRENSRKKKCSVIES